MKFSKLSEKVVINISTGEVLGNTCDLEFDTHDFEIRNFIVQPRRSFFQRCFPWFCRSRSVIISIEDIEFIGNDVVLIRMRRKG